MRDSQSPSRSHPACPWCPLWLIGLGRSSSTGLNVPRYACCKTRRAAQVFGPAPTSPAARTREHRRAAPIEGQLDVLLDEDAANPQVAANPPDRREDGVDHHRGEPERRLVEQHEIRPGHQGAPDRQHLLLAARQGPGELTLAGLQHRKQREHLRHQVGNLACGPGDGADLQILADGHPVEDPAALRHQRQTMASRGMRRLPGHVVTVEADRP